MSTCSSPEQNQLWGGQPTVRKRAEESKAEAGAHVKLWRSTREGEQRLPGDYWCTCVSLERSCFITQECSSAHAVLTNPRGVGFVLWVNPLPARGTVWLAAALPSHHRPIFPPQQRYSCPSDFRALS